MGIKIAIVVQRYGVEVNGGAEYHARVLAEKLSDGYEVEVLTTTALDYHSWANHYPSGEESINGIKVYRFPTVKKEKKREYRVARRAVLKERKYFKLLKASGLFNFFDKYFNITEAKPQEIENWVIDRGLYCPDLISFIKSNKEQYDAFIFFTYLYHPTVIGMPIVADKSIFIPTAHDESLLYMQPNKSIFSVPKFIMYNTESEKKLIEDHFEHCTKNHDIAGVGIEKYMGEELELPNYVETKKYFVYIGRIVEEKGCDQMLEYYVRFQQENIQYNDYKLVLIGKNDMGIPYEDSNILYTGFIPEELKYTLLRHAKAMIMPSFYESLSMVTLEAMKEGIPVIVNQKCEVLYEHIMKSGTGSAYDSYESFCTSLISYIDKSDKDMEPEAKKAERYVTENYTWDTILSKFHSAFNFVVTESLR